MPNATLEDILHALTALPSLVHKLQAQAAEATNERPMSAHQAARRAKRRTAKVLAALKSGELPGRFIPKAHGGKGRYEIMPADVDAWARLH